MTADDLIAFLKWAEEKQRPRLRLCEVAYDNGEHVPIFQRYGRQINGTFKYLDEDMPGQAGVRSIVEDFNSWLEKQNAS